MDTTYIYKAPMAVTGQMSALVTTPTGFDPARESLPVILFLHGLGECGDDVDLIRVNGIPKLFGRDPDYHGLRVITVSPQCPNGYIWNHLTYPLKDWFMTFVDGVNGDKSRLSITGLSLGGFGTWDLICTFPEIFSCAAPVCGGGLAARTGVLTGKPIRAYHSIDDGAVPFHCSSEMVLAARACGAKAEMIPYDGYGHASWVPAYEQTDLIEWLIAQRLPL